MRIADIYDPTLPNGSSAQDNIFASGLKELYDQILRIIFDTKVVVSPLETFKGKPGKAKGWTGAPRLAESLNEGLAVGLRSAGWARLRTPGSNAPQSEIDWYKSKKSSLDLGKRSLGIGLETQFGNHLQFTQDIQRLTNAQLDLVAEAGIIIVPSDRLASHKADRGASFSDARRILAEHIKTLQGSRARVFPALAVIAIEQDGYNDDQFGVFEITPVQFNSEGTISPSNIITNAGDPLIIQRKKTGKIIGPKS